MEPSRPTFSVLKHPARFSARHCAFFALFLLRVRPGNPPVLVAPALDFDRNGPLPALEHSPVPPVGERLGNRFADEGRDRLSQLAGGLQELSVLVIGQPEIDPTPAGLTGPGGPTPAALSQQTIAAAPALLLRARLQFRAAARDFLQQLPSGGT